MNLVMRHRCAMVGSLRAAAAGRVWLFLVLAVLAPACDRPAPPTGAGETTWDSCYVHGEKVGYIETTHPRKFSEGTRELRRDRLRTARSAFAASAIANQMDVHTTSVESPAGEVLPLLRHDQDGPRADHRPRRRRRPRAAGWKPKWPARLATSSCPGTPKPRAFKASSSRSNATPMQPGETRRDESAGAVGQPGRRGRCPIGRPRLESTKLLEGTQDCCTSTTS